MHGQTSSIFPWASENRVLMLCAGTRLPRRHKCVARTAAVLSFAFNVTTYARIGLLRMLWGEMGITTVAFVGEVVWCFCMTESESLN
jgi:hypothetical protein